MRATAGEKPLCFLWTSPPVCCPILVRQRLIDINTHAMKFRQLSIALFLIAGLVAVVTIFLSTFAAVVFHEEREQRWSQLRDTLIANVDQQAAGLALPVWNMDETNILAILHS